MKVTNKQCKFCHRKRYILNLIYRETVADLLGDDEEEQKIQEVVPAVVPKIAQLPVQPEQLQLSGQQTIDSIRYRRLQEVAR